MSGYNNTEMTAKRMYDRWRELFTDNDFSEWGLLGDEYREAWRQIASLARKAIQEENAMLRATIERAKMRGFVMVEGESLAWDFARDGKASLIVYAPTEEDAKRHLINAGIDWEKGELTLAKPIEASGLVDNQNDRKPKPKGKTP